MASFKSFLGGALRGSTTTAICRTDVLGTTPNFGGGDAVGIEGNSASGGALHNVGLLSNTYAELCRFARVGLSRDRESCLEDRHRCQPRESR